MAGFLSNVVGGVDSFANKIGSGISGLVQLPGAMYNAATAGNQATNAQNAAAGKSYIPNYNGAYAGQGIIGPNVNTGSVSSGVAGATAQNQNAVNSSGGVSSLPGYVNPSTVSSVAPPSGSGGSGDGSSSAKTGDSPTVVSPTVVSPTSVTPNPNPGLAPLSAMASTPTDAFTQAQNAYNTASQQLQQSKENEAGQETENGNGLIPLNFMAGRNSAIQGESLAQQNALTGTMNAEVGQEGAQTAQQTAQQSGLASVAGLEAPVPGQSPATQTYNPAAGTYTPLAAYSAGNGTESAQSALAGVGTTLGGETAGANLVPLKQGLDAGKGAEQNINSYLADNPDLNSSTFNLANLANQWIAGQYSGANAAKYQTLGNFLTTFATQMAPLLAPGGTGTDASRALQQSLVNGSANNQTISQVLAQLSAEAQATYDNRASGAAGGGTVAGGSSVTNVAGGTNSVSEGTTQSVGGGNYVYQNGKWVAK